MRDCRRSSCFGRESLARLSIGVSGTKVTGPWSGQSDGYALSHSVHPAGRGRDSRDETAETAPVLRSAPRQHVLAQLLPKPVSTCFNPPVLGAFCSEDCNPSCYSQVGTNTSPFLSNSHQPRGKPACLMTTRLFLQEQWWNRAHSSPKLLQNQCKTVRSSFYSFCFWTHNYFLIISVIPPCFHLNSDNAEINAAPETWPRCSFCRTRCNKLLEYTFLRCHWREPKQASKKSQYHHLPTLSFSIRSAKNINHWKSLVQQIQEKAHHKMLSPQKKQHHLNSPWMEQPTPTQETLSWQIILLKKDAQLIKQGLHKDLLWPLDGPTPAQTPITEAVFSRHKQQLPYYFFKRFLERERE